jgi:hypothetical protein
MRSLGVGLSPSTLAALCLQRMVGTRSAALLRMYCISEFLKVLVRAKQGFSTALLPVAVSSPLHVVDACHSSYADLAGCVLCVQVSRMEAGDHWIVYGQVDAGKLNSEELTAVHHRKVGNHY